MSEPENRRPLASRKLAVFQRLAGKLARAGVSPNAVSIGSIFLALGAGAALAATAHFEGWTQRALWLAAALFFQLRLLANMLDGMIAVEGGKETALGAIYNEAPDRVSDMVILIGAGHAAGDLLLGGGAALLAVCVAYVRALGGDAGAGQAFQGPMAKPHRMFTITLAAIVCVFFPQPTVVMQATLWIIIAGCLVTLWRRLAFIARSLKGPS